MATRWDLERVTTLDAPARAEVARLIREERAQAPVEVRSGTVVEFRRGGHLMCGYLETAPRGPYRVMGVDGRPRRLRRDKIVDISRDVIDPWPLDKGLQRLQVVDAAREQARSDVDLDTLWRVVLDSGESRTWRLGQLLEVLDPDALNPTRKAGLLRALWLGDYFDRDGANWRPRSMEAVAQMQAAAEREATAAASQQELAAWVRRVADGGDIEPRPDDADEAVALLVQAAVREGSAATASLLQAAHIHGAGSAFDVLVRLGHWSTHENVELHRLGVPDAFSPDVQAAAAQLPTAAQPDWPGRRRWGGGSHAAVNGERAYRLRRNLWGRQVIDIHLALPALWVRPGGDLDADAAERGRALNLVERQIPLLPESVLQACRLSPEAARPALTLTVRLDDSLCLSSVALKMSRVRPQARLEDVDSMQTSSLQRLHALAQALRRRRRTACAWQQLRPSPWLQLRDDTPEPASQSPASLIDTELGLLASEATGLLCQQEGLPALYLTRGPVLAASDVLQAAPADADAEGLRTFLLEGRAGHETVETTPAAHAGLGLQRCVAVSSPTTRYIDLIMQRQLLALVQGGTPKLSASDLQQMVQATQTAREAARYVEGVSQRYWSLQWVAGLPAADGVSCVVVEPRGPGYLALIEGGPAGTFAPPARHGRVEVTPGERLRLHVEQVSARRNILRLADPRPE